MKGCAKASRNLIFAQNVQFMSVRGFSILEEAAMATSTPWSLWKADDGFVRPGILGFTLASKPLPDERSSQRSAGSMGPSIPKKNSAYGKYRATAGPGKTCGRNKRQQEEPPVGLEAGSQLKSQGKWLGVGGTFCGTLRTFVGI